MTPAAQRLLDKCRPALEATAAKFGVTVEVAAETVVQDFGRRAARSAIPSWQRDMADAVPDSVLQDIVREQRVSSVAQGPSGAGTSGQVTRVSVSPGLPGTTNGWREARPLGPPPGINHVDRLLDEADRRDRVELAQRIGNQRRIEEAARKLAEENKP
jgi:hypothetical protein